MNRDDVDDYGDDRPSNGDRQLPSGVEAASEDVGDNPECEVYDGSQPLDEPPLNREQRGRCADAGLDGDDYRMPGGFDDGLGVDPGEAVGQLWSMQNDRPDNEHEARHGEERVGYKRPPRSGRIEKGEVRNPYGRRGKRGRVPDLSESGELALLLADRLGQKVRVKSGGEERWAIAAEVIVDKLMRDAMGDCPKARAAALKFIERNHILDALLAYKKFIAEFEEDRSKECGWSDELERRFRDIEAEFFRDADQESLPDWLERKYPGLFAEYRREVRSNDPEQSPAPPARNEWGGYTAR